MKKICTKCGKEKFEKEFAFKNKPKGIRRSHCSECHSTWFKKHYKENKQYYIDKSAINTPKLRDIARNNLFTYLLDKECVDCGENDPVVLQFDHLRDKKDSISNMVSNLIKWESILKEIEKCEIVCANCHFRRTSKRAGWYKTINAIVV